MQPGSKDAHRASVISLISTNVFYTSRGEPSAVNRLWHNKWMFWSHFKPLTLKVFMLLIWNHFSFLMQCDEFHLIQSANLSALVWIMTIDMMICTWVKDCAALFLGNDLQFYSNQLKVAHASQSSWDLYGEVLIPWTPWSPFLFDLLCPLWTCLL